MFRGVSRGLFRGVFCLLFRVVFRGVFCPLSVLLASVRVRPLLRRPASELNRILNSSWLRAPHVSIATSSRASYAFRQLGLKIQISSARIRRPRARRPTTQLNPQRNRAQHSSAQHGKFHVSTARRSTAPGTVHRHRHLQHCKCPSPNSVS